MRTIYCRSCPHDCFFVGMEREACIKHPELREMAASHDDLMKFVRRFIDKECHTEYRNALTHVAQIMHWNKIADRLEKPEDGASCPICDGEGIKPDGAKCSACRGHGYI